MSLLVNKNFIVTGAASGIGCTTARRFAEEGANICIADRDIFGAEKVAKSIRETGGTAFACLVDITSPEDNYRMVEETLSHFGSVDGAFLNAGCLGQITDFFDTDDENFDRVIAINLKGIYLGLKSVGKAINIGGSVIVASSAAGTIGWAQNAPYSASKHGVIGLARSAADAFAKKGARVNVICPGMVNTMMAPEIFRKGIVDQIVAPDAMTMPPFRGLGSTQHIAELVIFLASSRASFITGSVYVIDGGTLSSYL